MISYVDEIEALFDLYEEEHLTEKEIFQRTIELVISHEFEKDYMYDLNDTLFNRGYSFQFDVKREKLKFDSETYYNLITNVTKSKDKTNQLIEKINNSNIPTGIKEFLIKASYRHLAFNYQNIAEYYAHADKEVQELMEESALVIIDYDNAIRNGYVQIKEAINEMIEEGINNEE